MSISIGLYPKLDLWTANKLHYITLHYITLHYITLHYKDPVWLKKQTILTSRFDAAIMGNA
jgi:hypothetical protein